MIFFSIKIKYLLKSAENFENAQLIKNEYKNSETNFVALWIN